MYIPAEIVAIIHDCLQYDAVTLAQCSLVSRSWLHSSRVIMFRPLRLHRHDIPQFVTFLTDNPTNSISPYVKNLTLSGYERVRPLDETQLAVLSAGLPNVKLLWLSRMDAAGKISLWAEVFPHTETLILEYMCLDYPRELFSLIGGLASLRALDVRRGIFTRHPVEIPHIPYSIPPPNISSLSLSLYLSTLLPWLQTSETLSLVSLQIYVENENLCRQLAEFLTVLGPKLQRFSLSLANRAVGDLFRNSSGLLHCTELRFLQIVCNFDDPRTRNVAYVVGSVFSQTTVLALEALEVLAFRFTALRKNQMRAGISRLDWSRLDDVAMGMRNLKKLTLTIQGPEPNEASTELITSKLPQCAQHNLLNILHI